VRDAHADRFALKAGDFVIVSKAKKALSADPFLLGDTEGHPFRGNQYTNAGEHVEVEGRSIKVTHSARARRAGDVLVPVDMAKFDAAWKQDTGFHIDPSGTGAIHGRLERIADFLKTSPQMDAAEVNVDADGRVGFTNGRHRMAYLRDKGVTRVPVSMTKESRANAKKHGLIAAERTDLRGLFQLYSDDQPRDEQGRFAETGSSPYAAEPRVFNTDDDLISERNWGKDQWVWKDKKTGKGSGMLLTGEPIPRAQLPTELYHVTTNAPAVEASGVLLGQRSDAGLGGGQADGVSFTSSKEDARVIQRELVRSVKIARGDDDGMDAIAQYAREDEKEAGLPPGTLDHAVEFARSGWDAGAQSRTATFTDGAYHDDIPLPKDEQARLRRSSTKDALNAYLQIRGHHDDTHPILKNPILFGRQEKLAKIDPDSIKTLTIPTKNIPAKALVTTGSDKFLHEVRAYADVPAGGATATKLYRDKLVSIINLPDISDVSFPSMVGAIPSKPPKRKRTRTLYKGVSLSRRPMKFEAKVLSLTEIPRRLDACRDTLLGCDEDRWRDTLHDLAAYGASEVLMELVRQGAPARLGTREIPVDVDGICAAVLADRARALTSLREDYEARLRRRRIGADRREALTRSFTDRRSPSLLKRFASRATNEAFALGRSTAMQALRRSRIPLEFELAYRDENGKFISKAEAVAGGEAIVDAVIQTAVMDTGTCDECAEVDGESMELGSDRQEELRPPYVKCLGGDACRCVQIALLSDGSEIDVDEIDEDTLGDHESDKPSKPSTKAAPEADTADTGDESDSED